MKLTPQNEYSEAFQVDGEHFIFAEGNGSITIERKLNGQEDFKALTHPDGSEMTFSGQGVLFNSSINTSRAIWHRIKATTTEEIEIVLWKGR